VAKFQALPNSPLVEAFRLGQKGQPTPAPSWFNTPNENDITDDGIFIERPKGHRTLVRWGDWIIKGVDGNIYWCKHDVFINTYKLVYHNSADKTMD
jgi:hypothetical protein